MLRKLSIARPSFRYLLREIVDDPSKAIINAFDIYKIAREHIFDEEQDIWYEISDMIDDFLYGENIKNTTRTS